MGSPYRGAPVEHQGMDRACRKSNPATLMVQSAQDRMADNASDRLSGA
jgi:hypothetical protein